MGDLARSSESGHGNELNELNQGRPDGLGSHEAVREAHAAALAALPGMTPARLRKVLELTDPVEAYQMLGAGRHPADPEQRWREGATSGLVERVASACASTGIGIHLRGSPGYPPSLVGDRGAPEVLFSLGDTGVLDGIMRVAIVGTRACSTSGSETARRLARELAELGVVVVSGLARGIDQAAHAGSLGVAGTPALAAGVPGTSLDRPQPASFPIWRDLAQRGVLLSEVAPCAPMARWRFAVRNRIMAAISGAVVVVECHERGGAFHTVRAAALRGIPVGAVPGSVRSPASAGTNTLLAKGAFVVRDAADVLAVLGDRSSRADRSARGDRSARADRSARLRGRAEEGMACACEGEACARVLAAVEWESASIDDVVERAGLGLADVAVALEELRRAGMVRDDSGWWTRA